jgi:hypothetical protein
MKELITAEMVREMAAKSQKQIFLSFDTTLITPAARDQAVELGIEIVEGSSLTPASQTRDWKKIREAIIQCLREDFGDQQLDEESVGTIVRMVLGRLG